MSWCTTADLDQFAAAAGDYLRSRAAENTLLLSAAQASPARWRGQAAGQPPGMGGPNVAVRSGTLPAGAGPAGTASAGTASAGTASAGTASAGTASAGTASAGTASAGTASAGTVPNGVGPLFGWWEPPDGSDPRGAFLHDPRAPLLIAGRAPEMAVALAALLAKTGRPVCGVDAPVDAADAFAAAWRQRAGTAVRVHGSCRVYRLVRAGAGPSGSPEPAGGAGPAGRLRVATAADRALLTEWLTAFATEAGERTGSPHDLAGDLIGYGGAVFWEVPHRASRLREAAQFLAGPHHRDPGPNHDAGYQPVAMAALTRPVAGMVRVSMVYTLPERRRNGYAAAATFAASRAALDGTALHGAALQGRAPDGPPLGRTPLDGTPLDGPPLGRTPLDGTTADRPRPVTDVVLVTDGSRPDRRVTRLGYQLVDERAMFRFGPPTGPLPRLNPSTRPLPRLPTGPLPRLRR